MVQRIINAFVIIVCLVSLGFSLCRVIPFEITSDTYIGVIVTLLSIIVTIVIGYQIFNIIEFKQKLEKQMEKNSKLQENVTKLTEQLESDKKDLEEKMKRMEYMRRFSDSITRSATFMIAPSQKGNGYAIAFLYILESITDGLKIFPDKLDSNLIRLTDLLSMINGESFGLKNINQKDGKWYLNSKKINVEEYVKSNYTNEINKTFDEIKKCDNYAIIKSDLSRIMTEFNKRVQQIIENPNVKFTQEENERIKNLLKEE